MDETKPIDFTKPIRVEIIEDEETANDLRAYLVKHDIEYTEMLEDHMSIDGVHIFEFTMTEQQMIQAINEIDGDMSLYQ